MNCAPPERRLTEFAMKQNITCQDWAIQAVADSAAAGTPTYCHGLAGRLELFTH